MLYKFVGHVPFGLTINIRLTHYVFEYIKNKDKERERERETFNKTLLA